MATITFTIDDNKISGIINAFVYLYPKDDGYTDAAWTKECIRRWVIKQVARSNMKKDIDQCLYSEDNTLLS